MHWTLRLSAYLPPTWKLVHNVERPEGDGRPEIELFDREADPLEQANVAAAHPEIVEQMLSYHVDTLQQDFSHAQSLTTDAYRPQLIAQQQAVQKAGATKNEYFAVSSAVLSATQQHASMLVALQGQRGSDPKDLKFITATVRVDFDKSGDGQWRVANLTVLKKPQMNQAGQ